MFCSNIANNVSRMQENSRLKESKSRFGPIWERRFPEGVDRTIRSTETMLFYENHLMQVISHCLFTVDFIQSFK